MPKGSSIKQRARSKVQESKQPTPLRPSSVFVWAQCDNAGCQKWRKLPPNTKVEEDVPWFCYMNPDPDKDTCSAPEESYNVETEEGHHDIAGLGEASSPLPFFQAANAMPGDRGSLAKRSSGIGSSRDRGGKRKASIQLTRESSPSDRHPVLGTKRQCTGEPLLQEDLSPSSAPGLPFSDAAQDPKARLHRFRRGQKAQKAQQGFEKLLAGGGEWEIVKGRGRAVTPAPAYIWDALAACAPMAAELAAAAANAASAAKYFEDPLEPHSDTHVQAAALTCRVAMVAAAALASEEAGSFAAQEGAVGGSDTGPGTAEADPAPTRRLSPPPRSPVQLPASRTVAGEPLGHRQCISNVDHSKAPSPSHGGPDEQPSLDLGGSITAPWQTQAAQPGHERQGPLATAAEAAPRPSADGMQMHPASSMQATATSPPLVSAAGVWAPAVPVGRPLQAEAAVWQQAAAGGAQPSNVSSHAPASSAILEGAPSPSLPMAAVSSLPANLAALSADRQNGESDAAQHPTQGAGGHPSSSRLPNGCTVHPATAPASVHEAALDVDSDDSFGGACMAAGRWRQHANAQPSDRGLPDMQPSAAKSGSIKRPACMNGFVQLHSVAAPAPRVKQSESGGLSYSVNHRTQTTGETGID